MAAWLMTAAGMAAAQPEGAVLTSAEAMEGAEEMGAGPNVGQQPRRTWSRWFEGEEEAAPDADGTAHQEEDEEVAAETESRWHVYMGVDFATAYISRGFVWEDTGLIVQPWADVWLNVWRGEAATVSMTMGTWSSLHSQATWSGTSDDLREHWYELDLYAGAALEAGSWVLEGRYCWYTSPSDAWETIEEVYLSAAFDDSECLGAWALQPTMILAIETGNNANDGYDTGTYLQLGIEPGFGLESLGAEGDLAGVSVSFPVSIGLSLDDYYESEDDQGEYDDVFGYVSAGVSVAVPLAGEGGVLLADGSWGAWELTAGVQVVWMGDAAASFNEGDEVEVVGLMGIGLEF